MLDFSHVIDRIEPGERVVFSADRGNEELEVKGICPGDPFMNEATASVKFKLKSGETIQIADRNAAWIVCKDDPPVDGVEIRYNEYSQTPSIGRGTCTSTDPLDPGYGAMRFFIENVKEMTKEAKGGQVTFVPDQSVPRGVNALRAGVQFGRNVGPDPGVDTPTWGFIYNSWPLGLRFEQALDFLYEADIELPGKFRGNGIELAQYVLDQRGGTQIVLPVIGGTAQVSGYFPQPIGSPDCNRGDPECRRQGDGIGLEGICTSGWAIRYLDAPQFTLDAACDLLVEGGFISKKTLRFYPPVGGQSVLIPMQRRAIDGFEFTVPSDDLFEFFPIKEPTRNRPLGNPDLGDLNCRPKLDFPPVVPGDTPSNCSQNIGQASARYAHTTSWHQPYLLAWIHIDKKIWRSLTKEQRQAIKRAAKQSVVDSFNATDSVQCDRLEDILDINDGIKQRRIGGIRRPVSADMTLATWPQEALDVLLQGRNRFFAEREGPENPAEKTQEQKEFTIVWGAARDFAESIDASEFDPAPFPSAISPCDIVPDGGRH
jgi:hypothetical protein